MNVWFVDDQAVNRQAWLASFSPALQAACELATFDSVPALFAALDEGRRPDVLFIDYFLGPHDGLEVVERFMAEPGPLPLLVAHSSVDRVNDSMVSAGAHLKMAKVRGARRTESIVRSIRTIEDLRRLKAHHVRA